MTFWDFIFPEKLRDKLDRDKVGRRATKEAKKRKREKKQSASEPTKGSSDPLPTSDDKREPSSQPKSSQAKTDVVEETSAGAMAGSSDPVDHEKLSDGPKSWEYDDNDKDGQNIGQKIKDIADQSVKRVRKIGSSNRSNRSDRSKMSSRPIKEKTLDRFMERVKARQESRVKSINSGEKMARDSECVFPTAVDAVRAESIVAKKEISSREKTGRRKEKKERKRDEEPSPSRSPREQGREKEEDSKRKSKEKVGASKEKIGRSKEKKKKKEKEGMADQVESTRSTRSDRSEKSEKSSRRKGRPSPLKQIQKIFPDLSKKGRQERREKNEQKKKEKEETLRRKSREKSLFVNGKPFWVAAGRMSEAEKAEMTQDDLPLNAAIILEVRKGNIDLPVLPNTVIKFDPWAPLEVLQNRDETLFNHKMLFANTIRSMINSADYAGTDGTTGEGPTPETPPEKEKEKEKEIKRVRRIDFGPHPTFHWNYDRSNPSKVWREVFRWTGEGIA